MKITAKGQITIPLSLGKKHGLAPGAKVELVDQPTGVLVTKSGKSSTGKRVVETLLKGGRIRGTTEQWLRQTRGPR